MKSTRQHKVETKRITVDVSPSIHKALKRRAVEEDTTVSEILRRYLDEWLVEWIEPSTPKIYRKGLDKKK